MSKEAPIIKSDRNQPVILPMAKLSANKIEIKDGTSAIEVVDVSYTYYKISRNKFVLKGLNINVPKGQIYALLGPSGCGKTTILKCITGTFTPTIGHVVLPLKSSGLKIPGDGIGYMPQEFSLFKDLTIQETLWLFGRINGVKSADLQKVIARWSKQLDLPPGHRLVGNLSGGQQRRVSLICAFLHDAPLLVLDEPTVGIDPLLRMNIWNIMLDLSKKGTTILLTTHYIDEAKDAHMVGLMREGQMLMESTPADILKRFNETILERCFYRICVLGEKEKAERKLSDQGDLETQPFLAAPKKMSFKRKASELFVTPKLRASKNVNSSIKLIVTAVIPSLITKNFNVLKRNWFVLSLQFLLPLLTVSMIGICIGRDVYDLPLAVVNDEDPQDLSLEFLRHLGSHKMYQNVYQNLSDAVDSVKNGQNKMVLHIPRDFTNCYQLRLDLGINTNGAIEKCAFLYLKGDTTNQIVSFWMFYSTLKSFHSFQTEFILKHSDLSPLAANAPIEFREPIYGKEDSEFTDYITSSVLLVFIHFLASALTGITLLLEKNGGVLERFEVCGVTKTQVFVAQLLTNLIVVTIQVVIMLGTQFSLFDTVLEGSFLLLVLFMFLQGFCGMTFGFFISALASTTTSGIFAGIGAFLPTLILSGFLWPLEGMPVALRWFARFVPVTQTNEGLRSILLRGWGLENFQVQMGLLSAVLWSAFFLVISLVVFRIK